MRRADELLVTSLKFDERRRYRRRIIIWFSIGGLIMLTIVCALLLATSVETEKAGQLTTDGWDLWKAQKYEEAIGKFEEAVKADPKNASAWNGLGWAQFNSGHYDKVEQAFKKVLALEPKHPAALNGLGQLFLVQRKYDQAVKYLLQAAPQAPAAWYGLARVYLIQGKFDDAAKWAKKIVDSGDADDLAKQMLRAAQDKKLPDELKRQIDPAGTPPQEVTQAWRLMNQGRREEAKALFEVALAKSPKDASVLNGLGWFYLFGGDAEQAKPYFEKALQVEPLAGGSMNGLARVLKAQGNLDGAMKIWQEMVDKIPGAHAGTAGLADAYIEKGEFAKAVPLLEQLAKASVDDEEIKKKLAHAREEAKKAETRAK
jgi:superkiller protein 3